VAKGADLEVWLERLRGDPSRDTLAEALQKAPSVAVARAARLARDRQIADTEIDLCAAFSRFFVEPLRRDAGCLARTAIAEALVRLEHADPAPFLRGIRCVQLEPVFGGRVDTAVDLRGACAFGLAWLAGDEPFQAVVELLADAEAPARISAARALVASGRREAVTVLRLRALLPEPEPRVLSETLLALLRLDTAAGLSIAERLIGAADAARAQAAAIALGESRLAEALPLLRDSLAHVVDREARRERLLAIAALRRDEALAFLLEAAREGTPPAAEEALEALSTLAADGALRSRVEAAVAGRDEERVIRTYRRLFGT
jgi:hypothetical protein